MNKNDLLRGLTPVGYKFGVKFDEDAFNPERIDKIRNIIRMSIIPRKTINKNTSSSYNLKHIMERSIYAEHQDIGYIGNGELIYSMILEGYEVERKENDVYFNITSGCVDRLNQNKRTYGKATN